MLFVNEKKSPFLQSFREHCMSPLKKCDNTPIEIGKLGCHIPYCCNNVGTPVFPLISSKACCFVRNFFPCPDFCVADDGLHEGDFFLKESLQFEDVIVLPHVLPEWAGD